MKVYMEYKAIITYDVPEDKEMIAKSLTADDHRRLIDEAINTVFVDFGGDIHSRMSRYRLIDEPVQDIEEQSIIATSNTLVSDTVKIPVMDGTTAQPEEE